MLEPHPMDVELDDVCWICLDDSPVKHELMSPCKCPRRVHPKCLARWQLQQAGRPEETHCRFCNSTLADWKASLTPDTLKPEVDRVQPIMVVYFEGEIHRIPVKQGRDGLHEFTDRIRELFRLPEDVDISLTFGCKEPMSGQHLKLEGIGAFDAAVHCASVAAAERQQKNRSVGGASDGGSMEEDGTSPTERDSSGRSVTTGGVAATSGVGSGSGSGHPDTSMMPAGTGNHEQQQGLSVPMQDRALSLCPANRANAQCLPPNPLPGYTTPDTTSTVFNPFLQRYNMAPVTPIGHQYHAQQQLAPTTSLLPHMQEEERLMLQQHLQQMGQPLYHAASIHTPLHSSHYNLQHPFPPTHTHTHTAGVVNSGQPSQSYPIDLRQPSRTLSQPQTGYHVQGLRPQQAPNGAVSLEDPGTPFMNLTGHASALRDHLQSPTSSRYSSPSVSHVSSLVSAPPSLPSASSFQLAPVNSDMHTGEDLQPFAPSSVLPVPHTEIISSNSSRRDVGCITSNLVNRRACRSSSQIVEALSTHAAPASPPLQSPVGGGDSIAVGSLSGRFKYGLKALSRKLVRSLPFVRAGEATQNMYGQQYSQGGHAAAYTFQP